MVFNVFKAASHAVSCEIFCKLKRKELRELDFFIDKLTNSIELVATRESFDTVVARILWKDRKEISGKEWQFKWLQELKQEDREVYKLTTINNPTVIHGLLSLSEKSDHIFLNLIESAKFNKGRNKIYNGVPANLVAYSCKYSFDRGHEGFVAFDAKTVLIKHYEETLRAQHFGGNRMIIYPLAAVRLIDQYFNK
jgi:predicted ATPase